MINFTERTTREQLVSFLSKSNDKNRELQKQVNQSHDTCMEQTHQNQELTERLNRMEEWYKSQRDERTKQSDTLSAAKKVLRSILDCPRNIDEATVPKGGIDVAPEQVVFNMSISLSKIRSIEEVLK